MPVSRSITLFFFLCLHFSLYASSGTKNVRVHLVPQYNAINQTMSFRLGIYFNIKPGWHIYWKNPGDSGMSTKINWELNDHIKVKKVLWPIPRKIQLDSITSYGYENKAFVVFEFRLENIKKIEFPGQSP